MQEFRLEQLTWPEVEEIKGKLSAVIVPVGSTEQHGRHLICGTDYVTSRALAERCAQEAESRGILILVTPPLNFGLSWYHKDFPGTITLSFTTFHQVVKDVCRSLIANEFKNPILLNSHGGNTAALNLVINEIYSETRKKVMVAQWWQLAADVIKDLKILSPQIHVEEVETSVAMALGLRVREEEMTKDCFDRKKVHKEKSIPTSDYIAYDALHPGYGVAIPMDFIREISASGVVGDATKATREKGEKIVNVVVNRLVELCIQLGKE
jgi:creatinine amidohydrolase